jgi:hypothetical protein
MNKKTKKYLSNIMRGSGDSNNNNNNNNNNGFTKVKTKKGKQGPKKGAQGPKSKQPTKKTQGPKSKQGPKKGAQGLKSKQPTKKTQAKSQAKESKVINFINTTLFKIWNKLSEDKKKEYAKGLPRDINNLKSELDDRELVNEDNKVLDPRILHILDQWDDMNEHERKECLTLFKHILKYRFLSDEELKSSRNIHTQKFENRIINYIKKTLTDDKRTYKKSIGIQKRKAKRNSEVEKQNLQNKINKAIQNRNRNFYKFINKYPDPQKDSIYEIKANNYNNKNNNIKNICDKLLIPVSKNFNNILMFIHIFLNNRSKYFTKIFDTFEHEEDIGQKIKISKLPKIMDNLSKKLKKKREEIEQKQLKLERITKKEEDEIKDIQQKLDKCNKIKTKYYDKIIKAYDSGNQAIITLSQKFKGKINITMLKKTFEEVNDYIVDETIDPPQKVKHTSYTKSIFENSIFKKLFDNNPLGNGEIYRFEENKRGNGKHSLVKVKESKLTKATEKEAKDSEFMKLYNQIKEYNDNDGDNDSDYYKKLMDGVFYLAYIKATKADTYYNIEKTEDAGNTQNTLGDNGEGLPTEHSNNQSTNTRNNNSEAFMNDWEQFNENNKTSKNNNDDNNNDE